MAYLELKLGEHGLGYEIDATPRSTDAPASPGRQDSDQTSTMASVNIPGDPSTGSYSGNKTATGICERVLNLTQRGPLIEPAFSKVLLSELMRSRATRQVSMNRPSEHGVSGNDASADVLIDFDTSPVALPTRQGAQSLLKAYFHFANMSMPLLHEPTLTRKLDLLYGLPRVIELDGVHNTAELRLAVFFVFEVFAVALLTLQKQDPSRIPTSLADRYHQIAVRALSGTGLNSDVEGVQALLLVAQYSYHHPTIWAVWKTVGAALRLAVELGLHQETPSEGLDFLTLDTRRRTFWVAYAMDRNISNALGLPSCLSDGAITAKVRRNHPDANMDGD